MSHTVATGSTGAAATTASPTLAVLDGGRVKFNVGGAPFDVALSTLQKYPDTLLCMLADGKFPKKLDENGRIFIDRDPRFFNDILNFYRYDMMPTIVNSIISQDRHYYGLVSVDRSHSCTTNNSQKSTL